MEECLPVLGEIHRLPTEMMNFHMGKRNDSFVEFVMTLFVLMKIPRNASHVRTNTFTSSAS
eukprot:22892-Amphidinium_carterae.1